jgi:beta-barrel assembly-enhancing protease
MVLDGEDAAMTPVRVLWRALGIGLGLTLGAALWASPVGADQWPPTSDEVKLGAQIAKEIEAHYRIVTNPAQVERLTRVASALTQVVERQDLTYHFKIVDIPGVNSLAVPGGWVFVTEGMMKFVRSDDELAAVLAHELTHINHRHYYIQAARAQHMTPGLILAAALSVLARSPAPLVGEQLATQGAMSDYQRDLERDADLNGIAYLTKTPYSPVAMLTLMEHLSDAERYSGVPTDLGIYQDHPTAAERVEYIRADLIERHIPIVRRTAEGYLKIALDPETPGDGQPVTIRVDGVPVLTIGAAADGRSPIDRAQAAAARLDAFFNQDPAAYDVRAVSLQDHWQVVGHESVLFEVTPEDASYAHTTPRAVAEDLRGRLVQVIAAAPYNRKF